MAQDLAGIKKDLYELFNTASAKAKSNLQWGKDSTTYVTLKDVAALAEAIVSIERLEKEIAESNGGKPFIGRPL